MALKYDLNSLGWYNFEFLSQTLLKWLVGTGVTPFGGSKDLGRDATFQGRSAFPSTAAGWDGNWIFQVKHSDFSLQGATGSRTSILRAFKKELGSVLKRQLAHGFPCHNYILVTNVPLTSSNKDRLALIACEEGFSGNFRAIDGNEFCQFLDFLPEVRRTYPQLLALSDLEAVVNREIYSRSKAFLNTWQHRLKAFVRTKAYDDAHGVLVRRHFLVLDGPPEAGKSTIAGALSISYMPAGFEVIEIQSPSQFYEIFDQARKQVFVADDAIGSVKFNPATAEDWSRDLVGVLNSLDSAHFLIWTVRRYVLEEALTSSRLGDALDDFPGTHEVLVEVGALTRDEKAAMLYNHAKLAGLSEDGKATIRNNASLIVDSDDFTPERLRQLIVSLKGHDSTGQDKK